MTAQVTPLGFLPVNMEIHSHCMLVYNEKNSTFIQAIAEFMAAGIKVGELTSCMMPKPSAERLGERLGSMGIDVKSKQVCVFPNHQFSDDEGKVDIPQIRQLMKELYNTANLKYSGLRSYADHSSIVHNRISRLKWLESETLLNVSMPSTVSLCGYESKAVPRSFLLQAKSLHPYIANLHSIRRNNSYKTPSEFLPSFYQFKRISKIYPFTSAGLESALKLLAESTVRTPLDFLEIDSLKYEVRVAYLCLMKAAAANYPQVNYRIYVTYSAEPEWFTAVLKVNGVSGAKPLADISGVESSKPDAINDRSVIYKYCTRDDSGGASITLTKRYEYFLWKQTESQKTDD